MTIPIPTTVPIPQPGDLGSPVEDLENACAQASELTPEEETEIFDRLCELSPNPPGEPANPRPSAG